MDARVKFEKKINFIFLLQNLIKNKHFFENEIKIDTEIENFRLTNYYLSEHTNNNT